MKKHIELCRNDSIISLKNTIKKTRDSATQVRLKSILFRKEGSTPQEIAQRLMVTDRSVTGWIRRYNENGIPGLATKPSGRPEGNPKWDKNIFNKLTEEIDKGGYWSVPRMQEWLAKHHNVNIPEQTVWYRIDQLGYSYKGARPHPVKGNKEKQNSFKKGALLRSWSH
jgi:transposase